MRQRVALVDDCATEVRLAGSIVEYPGWPVDKVRTLVVMHAVAVFRQHDWLVRDPIRICGHLPWSVNQSTKSILRRRKWDKHNTSVEQQNKNIQNTLRNMTAEMHMQTGRTTKCFEKTSMQKIYLMCGGRVFQYRAMTGKHFRPILSYTVLKIIGEACNTTL